MYTSKRDYKIICTDVCTCMHITHYHIIYIQIIFIYKYENNKYTCTYVHVAYV